MPFGRPSPSSWAIMTPASQQTTSCTVCFRQASMPQKCSSKLSTSKQQRTCVVCRLADSQCRILHASTSMTWPGAGCLSHRRSGGSGDAGCWSARQSGISKSSWSVLLQVRLHIPWHSPRTAQARTAPIRADALLCCRAERGSSIRCRAACKSMALPVACSCRASTLSRSTATP